jgi:hypothetical protein
MTDHEGKAVAARVPYLHVRDRTNDAGELHSHSTAVAILDAHRARAALILIFPQPKKRPQLGGELRPLGAVVPGGPSTTGDPSTVPIHPGEGFWINPFGLENGAGSLAAYFELMVVIRFRRRRRPGDSAPIRTMRGEGRTAAGEGGREPLKRA